MTSQSNINKNHVVFASQLRVLAFLSVVVSHWLGVFWGSSDFIAYYVGGSPVVGYIDFYNWIQPPLLNFNYGSFGVALFF